MRTKLALLSLSIALLSAQQDREIRLTPDASIREYTFLLRGIADVQQADPVIAQPAIAIRGTAAQIALAEWLVSKLDKPANQEPGKQPEEYRISNEPSDIVRIFYIQHNDSRQSLNELATAIRSTGELRRLFVDSRQKAIVVRGTAEQISLTGWMIHELDDPQQTAFADYNLSSGDDHVRIFRLAQADTPRKLNEIATQIRTTGQLPRVFTFTPQKALAVRGTASQIAAAEGLLMQFDR